MTRGQFTGAPVGRPGSLGGSPARSGVGIGRSGASNACAVVMGNAKPQKAQRNWMAVFALILFSLFITMLLVALGSGVQLYSKIAATQADLSDHRLATSLVANSIRSDDAYQAVSIGEGPEGPSLELAESYGSGGYVTRLYLYDGALWQEYALAESDYDPDQATKVVETESFDISVNGNLVTVTTDAGTSHVMLRADEAVSGDATAASRADSVSESASAPADADAAATPDESLDEGRGE